MIEEEKKETLEASKEPIKHQWKNTKVIIDDISKDIEKGLTTCYGDYRSWNKKSTN